MSIRIVRFNDPVVVAPDEDADSSVAHRPAGPPGVAACGAEGALRQAGAAREDRWCDACWHTDGVMHVVVESYPGELSDDQRRGEDAELRREINGLRRDREAALRAMRAARDLLDEAVRMASGGAGRRHTLVLESDDAVLTTPSDDLFHEPLERGVVPFSRVAVCGAVADRIWFAGACVDTGATACPKCYPCGATVARTNDE